MLGLGSVDFCTAGGFLFVCTAGFCKLSIFCELSVFWDSIFCCASVVFATLYTISATKFIILLSTS